MLHNSKWNAFAHEKPFTPFWCAELQKAYHYPHFGDGVKQQFVQALRRFFKCVWSDQQLPVLTLHSRLVSMHFHNQLSGTRVGEAKNPGPNVRVAVINPTALYGKSEDILALNSHVVVASETSATDHAQKLIRKDFASKSFSCSFSKAVPDKKPPWMEDLHCVGMQLVQLYYLPYLAEIFVVMSDLSLLKPVVFRVP